MMDLGFRRRLIRMEKKTEAGVSLARDKGQGGQKNAPYLRGVWSGCC